MIGAWIEDGKIDVRALPRPRRSRGYALIRLRCAGICNTDIELLRGYYGFRGVPGHEFVGSVVAADDEALVGKRVVGEINLDCGRCEWCQKGLGRHCPNRTVLGIVGRAGAFQEYFTLPERNLHVVPDSMPDEIAVFAEPAAAACEILEQVNIPRGGRTAVLGDGKLGLLVAQVLQARGAKVDLYGHHRSKLRIVRGTGIRTRVGGREAPSARYGWVVDATGTPGGFAAACRLARPRGTVIMKSTIHDAVPVDMAPLIVNEITLVGSRCGPFAPALRLLRTGKIRVREMISRQVPLSQAAEGFELAMKAPNLKILLTSS